jgi:hypothetical protein
MYAVNGHKQGNDWHDSRKDLWEHSGSGEPGTKSCSRALVGYHVNLAIRGVYEGLGLGPLSAETAIVISCAWQEAQEAENPVITGRPNCR